MVDGFDLILVDCLVLLFFCGCVVTYCRMQYIGFVHRDRILWEVDEDLFVTGPVVAIMQGLGCRV